MRRYASSILGRRCYRSEFPIPSEKPLRGFLLGVQPLTRLNRVGLCDSAWETMSPFVLTLACGGSGIYGKWMKNDRSAMISCNDGFRPVSFLIEALDEEAEEE